MAAMQDRELGVEGAGPTVMLVNAEAEQGCRAAEAPSNNTHTLKLRARCMTQSRLEVRVGLEVRRAVVRAFPLCETSGQRAAGAVGALSCTSI